VHRPCAQRFGVRQLSCRFYGAKIRTKTKFEGGLNAAKAEAPPPHSKKHSSITFNVGAPTFPLGLPILFAKPRPIPPQQLATPPNLIRNHPARILIIARRMRPRRNPPALFHQLARTILSHRPPALPLVTMSFTELFASARRHKVRPASVVHPDPPLVNSPRISFLARRPAPLLHQLHSAPHVRRTEIPSPVI
jgi:hypothetical protein